MRITRRGRVATLAAAGAVVVAGAASVIISNSSASSDAERLGQVALCQTTFGSGPKFRDCVDAAMEGWSPTPTISEAASPSPSSACAGVDVPAGADLPATVNAAPAGTTFCLHGSYTLTQTVTPHSGDTFVGPADITGSIETAFELKAPNALGVTFDGLTMHGFSLRGIGCWTGMVVRNSEFYANGRNGLGCGLDGTGGVLIEGNYIHDNGSPGELGQGAGGMKFAKAWGLTVRDNRLEHNIGNGVWCDVDCHEFTATGNTAWGNTRKGIFFEISLGPALIENNTIMFNNCAPSVWGDGNPECPLPSGAFGPQSAGSPGGGIAANSSVHVAIRGNVLDGNEVAGINFRDDSRPYDAPFDILVENNILNGDALLHCGEWGITCRGNTP